ncbi:DUF1836 domain-containing protein [Acetobacterium paludosum]|uniref:DUF1836 domain-containing protein n=1 Tax=Acetobacterium paludosum TaxID=52693 RepID=A0A923KR50_9FIRM|nr:DUF1836 domain-containing protein [Acetobacterium paludosum]MBC3886882.1 DUF1836 domain-containing protein [Acetobacterium paludosum]
MNEQSLKTAITELELTKHMELSSIPNISLYMDQLTTLFDQNLSHKKRHPEDKLLTKTMINNYTKNKLLKPAEKKKYTRDHIILMVLLYELKQISSMDDIEALFSMIPAQEDPQYLDALYQTYLDCDDQLLADFPAEVQSIFSAVKEKTTPSISGEWLNEEDIEKTNTLLTALLLFQTGVHYKRLGEKIIDELLK